jgi:type I restriction enzyme S subunit
MASLRVTNSSLGRTTFSTESCGLTSLKLFVPISREFAARICLIKPSKLLSGRYLTAYLKTQSAQRQLRQHSKTGTVTNLHLREIRELLIPIPPLDAQRQWEDVEAALGERLAHLAQARLQMDALFSSLQSRAFSGQI